MAKRATTTPEERQEKIAEARTRLENMVANLADDAAFKAYLKAQASFHRYSWGNTLLILSQCPTATVVKGFQGWIALGRAVRKGEKGIKIFAPRPYTKTLTRDDGTEETRSGTSFGVTTVFDIAQTDPIPGHPRPFTPMPLPIVEGEVAEGLYEAAVALATGGGLAVQSADDGGYATAHGWYMPSAKAIYVRPAPAAHMLTVLIHELAHHHADASEVAKVGYGAEEVIVQSVAFVVCDHFGLDTDAFSARYVAGWLRADAKAFEKGLQFVQRTAAAMIEALEAALPAAAPVAAVAA